MLLEKSRYVIIELHFMKNLNREITSFELAELTNVTDRTIKMDIIEINNNLKENGARIVSRKNKGYLLEIIDEKKLNAYMDKLKIIQYYNMSFNEYSDLIQLSIILRRLLTTDDNHFVKITELENELLIPKKVLHRCIKKCQKFLSSYHIHLIMKPGYGTRITGDEKDIRMCILALYGFSAEDMEIRYIKEPFYSYFAGDDYAQIRRNVMEIIRHNNYTMNEEMPEGLPKYLLIMRNRLKAGGKAVHYEKEIREFIDKTAQRKIADQMAGQLSMHHDFHFDEDEIRMLAVYLLVNHNFSKEEIRNLGTSALADKIDAVYHDVKGYISSHYSMEEADGNQNLNEYLYSILSSVIVKSFLNIQSYENIIGLNHDKEVNKYPVSFGFATEILQYMKDIQGIVCSKKYVTHFTYYFMQALKKTEFPCKKLRLITISPLGIMYARILVDELNEKYGKYILSNQAKELYEIRKLEQEQEKIDLILLDNNILTHYKYDIPCYVVKNNKSLRELDSLFAEMIQINQPCAYLGDLVDINLSYDLLDADSWLKMLASKHGRDKTCANRILEYLTRREQNYEKGLVGKVKILSTSVELVRHPCLEFYKFENKMNWLDNGQAKYLIFYSMEFTSPLIAKCLSILLSKFQTDNMFLDQFLAADETSHAELIRLAVLAENNDVKL